MDINAWVYWSMTRVKEQEMKNNFRIDYFRRVKIILKSKLNGRNKAISLNTWSVSILKYGAGILVE